MLIIYDDLQEFTEARYRCEKTRLKQMCHYCPFGNRCDSGDVENVHTMCCEILSMQKPTYSKEREQG